MTSPAGSLASLGWIREGEDVTVLGEVEPRGFRGRLDGPLVCLRVAVQVANRLGEAAVGEVAFGIIRGERPEQQAVGLDGEER